MLKYASLYSKSFNLPSAEYYMPVIQNENETINAYFKQNIEHISSVSHKTHANLIRLCGSKFKDLLFHLPIKCIDRKPIEVLDLETSEHEIITTIAHIKRHIHPKSPRAPYRVITQIETQQGVTELHLVFFRAKGEYIQNLLPINSQRIISGKLELFDQQPQIIHPDYVVCLDKKNDLPAVQPIYQLTAGITQRLIYKALKEVTENLPDLPEWHQQDLLDRYQWVNFTQSLQRLHHPQQCDDYQPDEIYRQRIAYDAIFAHQLTLAINRATRKKKSAIAITHQHELANAIIKQLPFKLTQDQKNVAHEIFQDLKQSHQMTRMIQGDVGSGKTIVALLAASMMIQERCQVALMAPTEILAKQHFESLKPYCRAVGIRVGVLTGKDKASESRKVLAKLKDGHIDLIIGTHALIQEKVVYKNLALAIIDEQHRFGVMQRQALTTKSTPHAHLLLMTATPIPRSLAMAQYGDCDLSLIKEKPPFRKTVTTRVMPESKISHLMSSLSRIIAQNNRAYWVCPLVEDSEKIDLMAAEERFKILQAHYPQQVGLIHGKMKNVEKDAVMRAFMAGDISILVSTTVIEVGVNVPEATVMIIEEAERFGLSQLHQLRGRVGRGEAQSSCVLVYKSLNPTAVERLTILRETDDGFILAEKDLELRGVGDLLGTKQTGILQLPAFDFEHHAHFIKIARDDARHLLHIDPKLTSERGQKTRILLDLFEYGNFENLNS